MARCPAACSAAMSSRGRATPIRGRPSRRVAPCEVYWYDETQPLGDVRLPKWWRVLYKSGTEWKEVEDPSGYGIERDKFNVVTFKPVQATALRLDVQCQNEKGRWAMGVLEWRIK